MDYQEELDLIVSEKMHAEVAPIMEKAYKSLVKLGYFRPGSEGSGTAARDLGGWLFSCMSTYDTEPKLADYVFKASHINETRVSEYGLRDVNKRKKVLLRELLTKTETK